MNRLSNNRIYKKMALFTAALTAGVMLAACTPATPPAPPAPATPTAPTAPETPPAPAQKVKVRLAALKGPTGIGMSYLMERNQAGEASNDYQVTLAGSPDQISAAIIKGELDIAAVPVNLAAVLYNRTEGEVHLAAVNTLGVLYIVERGDSIGSIADLKGKTLYGTGQGSTPQYALNNILKKNGIDPEKDIKIEYKSEHAELASLIAAGEVDLAMLPEPFVTSTLMKNADLRVAADLTEEWEKVSDGSVMVQGGIIVSKKFAEENKEALAAFLAEYSESTRFVNENPEEAGALCEKFDIMAAAVAQKAIPNCNIVYMDGEKMTFDTKEFLKVIFDADPKSIGGKMPDEAFFLAG